MESGKKASGLTLTAVLSWLVIFLTVHLTIPIRIEAQVQRGPDVAIDKAEPSEPQFAKEPRFALVIGINRYERLNPLKGAVNDAKNLADTLMKYAGFPADQVVLLTSDQTEDKQPTKKNVLSKLSQLIAATPPEGLLLIAFAGHGTEVEGKPSLLLSDFPSFKDFDAISVYWLTEQIAKKGIKQAVLILDTCRTMPAMASGEYLSDPLAYVKLNRDVETLAILYATASGEPAFESEVAEQGYMTMAVGEALRGAAAGEDRRVTLGGLVKYVQSKVPQLSDKRQRPFTRIEGFKSDEMVLSLQIKK